MPEPRTVFAAAMNRGQVGAGLTPALLKAGTLYQMVDLLAPLKKRPYSCPFTEPSWSQTGA